MALYLESTWWGARQQLAGCTTWPRVSPASNSPVLPPLPPPPGLLLYAMFAPGLALLCLVLDIPLSAHV